MPWPIPFISLLVILATLHPSASQNTNPNPTNQRFDPFSNNRFAAAPGSFPRFETEEQCTVPPNQDPNHYVQPRQGLCGPESQGGLAALSQTDIQKLAEAYAPVLFFHPLEQFTLESPGAIFNDPSRGKYYFNNDGEYELVEDSLNLETLLETSLPNPNDAKDYFFVIEPTDQYKSGAGFYYPVNTGATNNPQDPPIAHSRAAVYYNVFDAGFGMIVFNYYFFYSWNGSQTFGFSVGNNQYSVVELDPYASHEGDWENMSVLVCAYNQETQPHGVTYRQHGFNEVTDCTRGQCLFYQDTYHPVGFSSLGSHATYPKPSRNYVYAAFPINLYLFCPGFAFFSDQTVYQNSETGAIRLWFPNSTNLVPLKDQADVVAGPVQDYWQAYGGRWGDSFVTRKTVPPRSPPRCLNAPQSRYSTEECPNVPLADAIVNFVASTFVATWGLIVPELGAFLQQGNGPSGPVRKSFYDNWDAPENALVWDNHGPLRVVNENNFCEWLGEAVVEESEFSIWAVALEGVLVGATAVSNAGGFLAGLFS